MIGNPSEIDVDGTTVSLDTYTLEPLSPKKIETFNAGGVGMAFGIGITF